MNPLILDVVLPLLQTMFLSMTADTKDVVIQSRILLFPDAFTTNKHATADMRSALLPYFQRMFNTTMSGVRDFVVTHRFGQPPVKHNDPIRESILMVDKHSSRPDLQPIHVVPR